MSFTPDRAFEMIETAHEHGRLAHGILISGPRGCGKEKLAARITRMLVAGKEASGIDLFGAPVVQEIPPLDELESDAVQIIRPQKLSRIINVDAIREVEKRLHYASAKDSWKVVVLVDVDRMNDSSQNAFLKTLEEPPKNTLLILITTQPQSLLPTTISRCVQLPLIGKADYKSDGGSELIRTLNQVAKHSFGTAWGALTIKAAFTNVLEKRKDEITKAQEALADDEIKEYRQSTDGIWLKEREEFHKAAARSSYLAERSRFFDIMMAWMADALRAKAGAPCEDFPEVKELITQLGDDEDINDLLRRVESLEDLRATLQTNATEQLAIESGFLKAFA